MIVLTSAPSKQAYVYSTASIADGTWHHVVYTYDGSGHAAGMKIWIDGSAAALAVYSDTLDGSFAPSPTQAFMFAAGPDSHIDELSLFNKVLSATRIKAHRDAANGGKRVEADTLRPFRSLLSLLGSVERLLLFDVIRAMQHLGLGGQAP